MRSYLQLYLRNKKNTITIAVLATLGACFFLFPIVTSFVVEPYIMTIKYSVQKEGIYTVKFDHYILVDPSTTFFSSEDDVTKISIKNVGDTSVTCWISNYTPTNSQILTGYYTPILDQRLQDRPGKLLDNEGNLGWLMQPYRTFHLEPSEQVNVSFHGYKRTFECPVELSKKFIKIWVNDAKNPLEISDESPRLDMVNDIEKEQKTATIIIPSYAFGKFNIIGPDGFNLKSGSIKRIGGLEEIPFDTIPLPFITLISTLIISLLFSMIGIFLFNHLLLLFKENQFEHFKFVDIPVFSTRDLVFLFISGFTILTFTGSVPPIHMLDSVYYVDIATKLRGLFSTFDYPPYRNPGYMLFIWFTRQLMGPGYGLILMQQFLFYITGFLIFKIVEYFTEGNRFSAWVTAFLYILNPLNLIYSQFIQPEGFWRNLIVFWAFSLVLLMKKNNYASMWGGIALGILWLSRNSAPPSIILFIGTSLLVAWKSISIRKHLFTTIACIVLIYSPYYTYLRVANTKSQSYYAAIHHSLSFLVFNKTLDQTSSCFANFRVDSNNLRLEKLPYLMPWMKSDLLYSPLNENDPTVDTSVEKAIAFEKCVYQANYLRFPKQQINALSRRMLDYLWINKLKDIDLWDYSKIYTKEFIPQEASKIYQNIDAFLPYYYSEKWGIQDKKSMWKVVFETFYNLWPYVNLVVVVFSFFCVLLSHYLERRFGNHLFKSTIFITTAFVLLYLSDAAIYSIFGVVFPARMMLAISPILLLVFGINVGKIINYIRS